MLEKASRRGFCPLSLPAMTRIIWAFVAVSAALIAGVAMLGDERQLGAIVASVIILGAVGHGLAPLLQLASNKLASALVVAGGLLAIGCALVPILEGLGLGEPLAQGQLSAVGDTLALPSSAAGPLRVLVHVPAPKDPARIHIELQGGATTLAAELDSTLTTVRLGRRGHGKRLVQNDSELIDTTLASGVSSLALKSVSGPITGPVTVEVFREWLPDWSLFALAGALILGLASIGAMTTAGTRPAAGIACALVFGLMAHRTVTPDHAVRPEVGALFVALVLGALGGSMLTLLIESYLRSRAARTAT
jgi:hypothetical protein